MTELTPKQEAFVFAYLETGNASEAYRRAYDAAKMSPAAVAREASLLLDNPKITQRIAELRAGAQQRHEVTFDRLVQEAASIALADPADYYDVSADGVSVKDWKDLSPEQRRALKGASQTITQHGGTIKVILHDKLAAMELVSKLLGYFDKHNRQQGEAAGQAAGEAITKVFSPLERARALAFLLEKGRQEKLATESAPVPPEAPDVDQPAG